MNTFVFDLETTGLPKYRNAKPFCSNLYNEARIIEIGYVILNPDGDIIKRVDHFIKYDEEINIENSHIHGISNEMVLEHGIKMEDMFDMLVIDLMGVDTLVAHNIEFDFNVLLSEVYRNYNNFRHLLGILYSKDLHCTMKMGKKHMKTSKFPKLTELHQQLFNVEWVQTHRALDDVLTCAKCYNKIIRN
jgi:DNA polymerase III epsilon subunit-like protein